MKVEKGLILKVEVHDKIIAKRYFLGNEWFYCSDSFREDATGSTMYPIMKRLEQILILERGLIPGCLTIKYIEAYRIGGKLFFELYQPPFCEFNI